MPIIVLNSKEYIISDKVYNLSETFKMFDFNIYDLDIESIYFEIVLWLADNNDELHVIEVNMPNFESIYDSLNDFELTFCKSYSKYDLEQIAIVADIFGFIKILETISIYISHLTNNNLK